jgi:hypothetical protein
MVAFRLRAPSRIQIEPSRAKPGKARPKTIKGKPADFLGFPCPNRAFSRGCADPLGRKFLSSLHPPSKHRILMVYAPLVTGRSALCRVVRCGSGRSSPAIIVMPSSFGKQLFITSHKILKKRIYSTAPVASATQSGRRCATVAALAERGRRGQRPRLQGARSATAAIGNAVSDRV